MLAAGVFMMQLVGTMCEDLVIFIGKSGGIEDNHKSCFSIIEGLTMA